MMNKQTITIFLALFAIAFGLSIRPNYPVRQDINREFKDFQIRYNKYYTPKEHNERLAIFQNNLAKIKVLNEQSERTGSSAKFGVTEFADLTQDEFRASRMSKKPAVKDASWPVADLYNQDYLSDIPDSVDWRTKGAVTPVKNQGQCGSCWSFSTTGNIEGQWFLAGNTLTSLSEQNLVDCDHNCMIYENATSCDAGCDGGLQPNAYTYVIKNGGIDTEASYPYQGTDGTCSFNKANVGAQINNFTMISEDETQMAAYLAEHGPIAIAADAVEWQFYVGGVFDLPCGTTLDHGILIVGYGNETTIFGHHKNYWIVKNSWGEIWGEKGYLKIERGVGKCGLNLFASSSIITPK